MNGYRSHVIDKVLATVAAILVLIVLIIITVTPPAAGFELSIYDSFPVYFWFFFIIANGCGIIILVRNAFTKQRSHWWLAGLCIIIIANAIFLGLPFLHGYGFTPTGDAMTHIGSMKNILLTGHLGAEDIYPGVHLLGASLLVIPDLTPTEETSLLFVCWDVLFLLNIYLLGTVITQHRGQALLITAFASPLIFTSYHLTIHPSYLSLYMTPLLLYFLHRRQRVKKGKVPTTVIIIMLVFVIVLLHQMTALFVIALLLAYSISKFLIKRIRRRDELTKKSDIQMPSFFRIALLMFTIFMVWNVFANNFDVVHGILDQLAESFSGVAVGNPLQAQVGQLSASGISRLQTVEIFIYRFAPLCIYGGISLIAVAIVFKVYWNKRAWLQPIDFTYAIVFIVACGISVFCLLGVTGEADPARIVRFIMMVAPIVSGLLTYRFIRAVGPQPSNTEQNINFIPGKQFVLLLYHRKRPFSSTRLVKHYRPAILARLVFPRNIYMIAVVPMIVIITGTFCVFGVYGSPKTVIPNTGISRFDLTGSEWFITHQNDAIPIVTDLVEEGRFRDLLVGTEGNDSYSADWVPPEVPSHFGYYEHDSISDILDCDDTYLLTDRPGRTHYLYLPASARDYYPQYTDEDYSRLRSDPAVIQIYANGEFEVWQVHVRAGS